ncbi:MAG: outer membrane beta-barrel protein [Bacteroidota bacterium]
MKKVLLTAVAVFSLTFVNAQEEEKKGFGFAKGDVLVEGNLMFNSNKDEAGTTEVKDNMFSFSPKVGFMLSDKLALGAEFMIGSGTQETTTPGGSTEDTQSSFGAGVFARYYFLDLGERFKTYAEAGLGFGSSKDETDGVENFSTSTVGFGIDLGMNYFVTERFAINFGLNNVIGFNSDKTEFPGGGETTSNGINANLNTYNNFFGGTPTFGLTWKF